MRLTKIVQRVRTAQVRVTAGVLVPLSRQKMFAGILQGLGSIGVVERTLVGYRRGFTSRAVADDCVSRQGMASHSHPGAIDLHIGFAEKARPSDYPVLYHLGRLLPEVRRVVDVGGNAGNCFYCYAKYLTLSSDFSWNVFDIDAAVIAGRALAAARGESRLHFWSDLKECGSGDLVLISGALHYLEQMPPELLAGWASKPKHVLVNRCPVTHGEPIYGIQDAGAWMTSAKVLSRKELLRAMAEAGYGLVDEWPVLELKLEFPLRPQNSVGAYSGFLFTLLG
jgi:putative methyltransferase (TIGR04325 family)